MIDFVNTLMCLAAGTLLMGVIGEKDKEKHRDITICFVAAVVAIAMINAFA